MERIAADAVTFDDVLLVPSFSEVLPSDVSLRSKLTRNIDLNIPMVAAAMDTVTESRLAIALAQEGGIGIVHKNMSLESQAKEVRAVKKFESGIIRDPVTISPAASLNDLINLTSEKEGTNKTSSNVTASEAIRSIFWSPKTKSLSMTIDDVNHPTQQRPDRNSENQRRTFIRNL